LGVTLQILADPRPERLQVRKVAERPGELVVRLRELRPIDLQQLDPEPLLARGLLAALLQGRERHLALFTRLERADHLLELGAGPARAQLQPVAPRLAGPALGPVARELRYAHDHLIAGHR